MFEKPAGYIASERVPAIKTPDPFSRGQPQARPDGPEVARASVPARARTGKPTDPTVGGSAHATPNVRMRRPAGTDMHPAERCRLQSPPAPATIQDLETGGRARVLAGWGLRGCFIPQRGQPGPSRASTSRAGPEGGG
jgi:hypothetical protein